MIIFPAMDIKDGKCVRLYKGDFNTSQIVGENPVDTAAKFVQEGAEYIHMVDLDGALNGETTNIKVIKQVLKEINIPLELGGGIRDMNSVETLFDIGVTRLILGTAALKNPGFLREAIKRYGDSIAVGIDAKDGFVALDGWINISKVDYIDFAKIMEDIGVKTIIFTDVSRDGTLTGPNLKQTLKLKKAVKCDVIAAGGVKDLEDIKLLKKENFYGVIIGKAIYSESIKLSTAIDIGKE
ncbi:MAG TPA: 1-(5-phosphoribosyl)-5-[(5-phosphoribosylamino)methylideneamino]imidazole-4-carboxamide isomerase [Clostridiaceae bacterium]